MTNCGRTLALLGIMLAVFFHAPSAQAQQPRTWISGTGDDVNPCTRTAPCRTFNGAMSKTSAGGEVDLLDPDGGGPMGILKSITIDGGNGQGANVTASGVNGVSINTGSTGIVMLTSGGAFGIGLDTTGGGTASVMVERTNVSENTGNGIQVTGTGATLQINNSEIQHNNAGGLNITAPADVRSFKNNVIAQNGTVNVTGTLGSNTPQ